MKIKRLLKIAILIAVFFVGVVFPIKGQAEGLPFSVRPLEPSTQRDNTETFFDLILAPNKSTALQVDLINNTDKPIKVKVAMTQAQTSDSGIVDYKLPQKRDESLKSDIADYFKGPKQVVIPAKQTYRYTGTLTMPAIKLPGIIAGGLTFTPVETTDSAQKKQGLSVKNQYNYEIATIARNVNQSWLPILKIGKATITQHSYQNTITLPMQNPAPTFLNQLEITTNAINLLTGKTYIRTNSDMQMAPNSHFFYRLELPAKVETGKYKVQTVAYFVKNSNGKYQDANGTHYQYKETSTTTLTLSAQKAQKLQQKLKKAKGGTPWFIYAIWIVIVLLVLILLVFIIFIILLMKKRKEKKEKDDENK
ncbi:WxL protein peptidoglycan domain-containing protein [Lactococcus nasutitermitis]|uniref:WxL protein peptidoglycan domain-containing protein n=1 Tax=Lactococcus nasutitermitis TaxID=1652957 RepID=A0ABV9JDY2_9LACT|nr:DUF916 domain-containing protein [Lactococcus nasutitermitis]